MEQLLVSRLTYGGYQNRRSAIRALTMLAADNLNTRLRAQSAGDPPDMPLCDLFQDLPAFRSRMVRLSGKLHTWHHGMLLYAPGCRNTFTTGDYVWPTVVSLASSETAEADNYVVHFVTDMATYEQLREYYKTSRRFEAGFVLDVIVEGEVRLRDRYTAVRTSQGWRGNGFGPLATSPAELIVKRIVKVSVDRKVSSAPQRQR